MKVCSKCGVEKELNRFTKDKRTKTGYRGSCKDCTNIWLRDYRKSEEYINRASERNKRNCKKYNFENKEKINEARRIFFIENPEAVKRYNKYKSDYSKSEKGKENRKNYNAEYIKNPLQRLKACLRARVRSMLKKSAWKKTSKTQDILGCTYAEARNILEQKFLSGMTWENHGRGEGRWHIDHIIPLSVAKTKREMEKLCHYTNLQPLWGSDNIRKSNKIMCNPCTYQWTRSKSWTDIPEGLMCNPTVYQGFK